MKKENFNVAIHLPISKMPTSLHIKPLCVFIYVMCAGRLQRKMSKKIKEIILLARENSIDPPNLMTEHKVLYV